MSAKSERKEKPTLSNAARRRAVASENLVWGLSGDSVGTLWGVPRNGISRPFF